MCDEERGGVVRSASGIVKRHGDKKIITATTTKRIFLYGCILFFFFCTCEFLLLLPMRKKKRERERSCIRNTLCLNNFLETSLCNA